MKLRRLVLAAFVAAALLVWWQRHDDAAPEEALPALTFAVPVGSELHYRFAFDTTSTTLMAGPEKPIEAKAAVSLAGELEWFGLPPEGDGSRVAARFVSLERHRLVVLGGDLLADPAPVLDQTAVIDFDCHGHILAMRFRPRQPAVFKRLVQLVTGEMQVSLPLAAKESWSATEDTHLGKALVRYERDEAYHLTKSRMSYDQIAALQSLQGVTQHASGTSTVTLDPQGYVERVVAQDRVDAERGGEAVLQAESTFSIELAERGDGTPPVLALAGYSQSLRPGEVFVTGELERNHLRQRVGTMTWETAVANLRELGSTGHMPDHNAWLWQVSGLLIQHPELCAELVGIFREPEVGAAGRALILDLLVGAGHPQAQAALIAALQTPEAKSHPKYGLLFQRLSLVERPTEETADFALAQYRGAATPAMSGATGYALGSVAGHLHEHGDDERAEELANTLEKDLAAADDDEERGNLIESLGNAALPGDEALLVGFGGDAAWQVRLATASALRDYDSPESREVLVDLSHDQHPTVQNRALITLAKKHLDEQDLADILAAVTAGQMQEMSYQSLVSLVTPYLWAVPDAEQILRAILAQDLYDNSIKGRIRVLLNEG